MLRGGGVFVIPGPRGDLLRVYESRAFRRRGREKEDDRGERIVQYERTL